MTVSNPRNADAPGLSSSTLDDWVPECVILSQVLDQHPRRLTIGELAREVGRGLDESTVRRAAGNLIAARFLLRDGDELAPAPAVVSFERLAA